jgi:ribose transport system ATP-binding protein
MHESGPLALRVRGVTKYFGDFAALGGASLTVRAGEVHGLIGHNGSGKSTLVKILAGFHHRDAGEIEVGTAAYSSRVSAHEIRTLGIGFVHQDLALVPGLSIADNLGFSARGFARGAGGFISWRRQNAYALEMLHRLGLDIDVTRDVGTLAPVEQTLVAIGRSLAEHEHVKLLVLDEPTARLPREEVARLLDVVRTLVRTGTGVLFISHRLDEVLDVCDKVTVFREGSAVAELAAAGETHQSLIQNMIGPDEFERINALGQLVVQRPAPATTPIIQLVDVNTDLLDGVSLGVRPGEVVVLTGSVGSGIDEVAQIAFGSGSPGSGTVRLGGEDVQRLTVARSRRFGSAFISSKRLTEAGFAQLSLADNIHLYSDGRTPAIRLWRQRAMRESVRRLLEQFTVRPPTPQAEFRTLSGGNQQKVLLAKWLRQKPRLLILSEPTQGVDPASRFELYELTRRATRDGLGVLWLTTDLDEVPKIADRVLVMFEGRLVLDRFSDELPASELLHTVLTGRSK